MVLFLSDEFAYVLFEWMGIFYVGGCVVKWGGWYNLMAKYNLLVYI